MRPAELLYAGDGLRVGATPSLLGEPHEDGALDGIRTRTPVDAWILTAEHALPLLRQHLRVLTLDGLGLGGHEAAAIAAGGLVHYLRQTKQAALEHLEPVRFYERVDTLELDGVSARNLELVEPLFSGESAQTTLLYTLDCCCTPMGKRLLRATLLRPSMNRAEIDARLDAVAEAASDLRRREGVRRAMDGVLDPLDDLAERVHRSLVDEPPLTFADGGIMREGVDVELDELRTLSRSGREALIAIEERERVRTGIGSLKVRFNSVFGYYIEISRANRAHVPPDYERKQTLVNAERFTTPELKEYEAKILTAQERSLAIERRLFAELRAELLRGAPRMRETARRVAAIALLASFAHLAALRGWTRPTIDDSGVLEFAQARHPVVERRMEESGSSSRSAARSSPRRACASASSTASSPASEQAITWRVAGRRSWSR